MEKVDAKDGAGNVVATFVDISKMTVDQLKKKLKSLRDDVAACDKRVDDLRQEYAGKIGDIEAAKAEKQAEITAIEAELKAIIE